MYFPALRSYSKGVTTFSQHLNLAPWRRAGRAVDSFLSARLAPAPGGATGGRQRALWGSNGGLPCGPLSGPLCGPLSGHPRLSQKAGSSPACRRLQASRFADISTSQQVRCTSSMRSRYLRVLSSLIAAHPSTRPSPRRWLHSACSAEPQASTGAAWCGAVVVPLLALAMARRGEDCQERRRPRARAQSARVTAIHRKEADLDRFVAALLALAADPGCPHSGHRHKPTGESSRVEQSCRR